MKVLVVTHRLETGGSQRNAIDLAAMVRGRGHEVVVHGTPGPMVELVESHGLPFAPAPDTAEGPTPEAVRALREVVARERIDLVHTYEWGQTLTAYKALFRSRTPMLSTIYSMAVPRWLPRTVPLVVGTQQMQDAAAAWWKAPVHCIEPPVDVAVDEEPADVDGFAREHGLTDHPDLVDLVVVSRLVEDMKAEGIRHLIDVMPELAVEQPVRLVVVGGGESFDDLAARADAANARAGRRAVVLTGPLHDPRPAYQLADVVCGMGSSALRGMVSGKPMVVLGVDGYSDTVTPESYGRYLWWGFLGSGNSGDPKAHLRDEVEALVTDPARRAELGAWGRERIREDFGLESMTTRLTGIYEQTLGVDPYGLSGRVEQLRSSGRRTVSGLMPTSLKARLSGGTSGQMSAVPVDAPSVDTPPPAGGTP